MCYSLRVMENVFFLKCPIWLTINTGALYTNISVPSSVYVGYAINVLDRFVSLIIVIN